MQHTGTVRTLALGVLMTGVALAGAAAAGDPHKLSDAELDATTAGSAAGGEAQRLLTFDVTQRTRSGRTVTVDGSLDLLGPLPGATPRQMLVLDRSQNNLQSVININAVNSAVNVLLNLNVNIDSRVDTLRQTNVNGL